MKSRPSSQVIVDPQELTLFLRRSQEFSDLVGGSTLLQTPPGNCDEVSTGSVGNGTGRGKDTNKAQLTPRTLRPMSTSILSPSHQQRRLATAKKGWKRYVGIPLAIASGFLFTLTFIIVKKLIPKYHPVTLAFWQFGMHFLMSIPILLYFRFCLKVKVFDWKNEVLRVNFSRKAGIVTGIMITCLCGATVLLLQFVVLKYLQVGDATIIAFSGSLFTIGFGHFYLYEKCEFITIPVSCFILFGIFLLTRPPFLTGEDAYNIQLLIGVSMALVTSILASAYLIAIRKLRKVHFSVILFVGGGLGVIECAIVTGVMQTFMVPDIDWNLAWILGMGILSFLATLCTLAALKYEEAGTVNLTRMMDVVFSFVLQYIFLRDIPDKFSLFGATIVLTGVGIIGVRSVLLTIPEENRCRRSCCCFLK